MDVYGVHTPCNPGLGEKFREKYCKNLPLTWVLHSLVRAGKTAREAAKNESGPGSDQSPDQSLEHSSDQSPDQSARASGAPRAFIFFVP